MRDFHRPTSLAAVRETRRRRFAGIMLTGCLCLFCTFSSSSFSWADEGAPAVERYLLEGQLQAGSLALTAHLKEHPQDHDARFGLGTLQFIQSVEHLVQSLHRYGLREQGSAPFLFSIPVLRLPTPPNENPETLSYTESRQILQTWLDDLGRAEATLAQVREEDVKLPLHFGLIRLDLNGDGQATENETLWRIFRTLAPGMRVSEEQARSFVIGFDGADVGWMRGYCHLLMAMGEIGLAYDGRELFEGCAHLFFPKVDTPHDYLQSGRRVWDFGGDYDIADIIALVHLIRMPVKEPERMQVALAHLEQMVDNSLRSWELIQQEKDDDHEWIPGPNQKGVIPGARVSPQMVAAWVGFLHELDSLLAGERLIPFWRSRDGRGVNLRRVFTEPTPLDLVLWIQGTAAAPYLEQGELTQPAVWRRLQDVFQGRFLGFAAWFN